jgi:hypothetical protein
VAGGALELGHARAHGFGVGRMDGQMTLIVIDGGGKLAQPVVAGRDVVVERRNRVEPLRRQELRERAAQVAGFVVARAGFEVAAGGGEVGILVGGARRGSQREQHGDHHAGTQPSHPH